MRAAALWRAAGLVVLLAVAGVIPLAKNVTVTHVGVFVLLYAGAAVAYNPQDGIGLSHGMLPVERNLLGFTGVALLFSLAIGGLLSWIGPLAYVGICQCAAIANYSEPLTWASRPPADRGGWIAALVVFAVGLAAFTIRGPRTRPSGE